MSATRSGAVGSYPFGLADDFGCGSCGLFVGFGAGFLDCTGLRRAPSCLPVLAGRRGVTPRAIRLSSAEAHLSKKVRYKMSGPVSYAKCNS